MDRGYWLTVYTYLMPLLAGFAFLNATCRVLVLWQKERSGRAVAFLLVHTSLFLLFLLFSIYARMTPLVPVKIFLSVTTGGYLLLAVALLFGGYYEWRDLVAFLRKKDAIHHEQASPAQATGAGTSTLKDVATGAPSIALEARAKEPPAP